MTPAEKRVAIAKDALAQLKTKVIQPTPGTYGNYRDSSGERVTQGDLGKSLCVPEPPTCEVCALGALTVGLALEGQSLQVEGGMLMGSVFSYLREFFDLKDLVLMETAFEGSLISFSWVPHAERDDDFRAKAEAARSWAWKYIDEPRKRLELILRNIIRNKGQYVVPK